MQKDKEKYLILKNHYLANRYDLFYQDLPLLSKGRYAILANIRRLVVEKKYADALCEVGMAKKEIKDSKDSFCIAEYYFLSARIRHQLQKSSRIQYLRASLIYKSIGLELESARARVNSIIELIDLKLFEKAHREIDSILRSSKNTNALALALQVKIQILQNEFDLYQINEIYLEFRNTEFFKLLSRRDQAVLLAYFISWSIDKGDSVEAAEHLKKMMSLLGDEEINNTYIFLKTRLSVLIKGEPSLLLWSPEKVIKGLRDFAFIYSEFISNTKILMKSLKDKELHPLRPENPDLPADVQSFYRNNVLILNASGIALYSEQSAKAIPKETIMYQLILALNEKKQNIWEIYDLLYGLSEGALAKNIESKLYKMISLINKKTGNSIQNQEGQYFLRKAIYVA